ncbi:hypothetical protein FGB62_81g01 [Gracilaria domingensis]|nr:hypothetical protein FGB62_81g01 [Gracilaria domingensis]
MAGSLVVLGAGVLKWHEVGSIFLLSFVYGGLLLGSSTGVFGVSPMLRRIAYWIDIAVIVISFLDLLFGMYSDYHGSHTDLFCTAQAIWMGDRNERQNARFIQMRNLTCDIKSGKGPGKVIRIWNVTRRRFVIDVLLYLLQCVAAVVLTQDDAQFLSIAKLVGLEVFELISVSMIFVNENLVEPTLGSFSHLTLVDVAKDAMRLMVEDESGQLAATRNDLRSFYTLRICIGLLLGPRSYSTVTTQVLKQCKNLYDNGTQKF